MLRYFIKLSYNGTAYNGWQSQPHKGTKSIQGTIEHGLMMLTKEQLSLTGCGRTDTGVHALDYYAHFDSAPIEDIVNLVYRLNKLLPDDIVIKEIIPVQSGAHARFDATSRSYRYHLHTFKDPFATQSFHYGYGEPDLNMLNKAAGLLLNFTDHTSFCKVHTDVLTMNCQITESRWEKTDGYYTYYVTSDRFLRGMIRLVVGMCLNVARGKVSIDEVAQAVSRKERIGHDWSVPAKGLFLCNVRYHYL